MSGFSPQWLALREPADHRARNRRVLKAVADAFAGRDHVCVVDLGCGTGATLRALAPHLAARQSWRLVDHDENLIETAKKFLGGWAEEVLTEEARLIVRKASKSIEVRFLLGDLDRDLDRLGELPADLVTASALVDLVSETWMTRLVATLAARRLPLYAALTYNGAERWRPPHPADAVVLAAFHAHQARDKGFGGAAGPRAAELLRGLLARAGYALVTGASPWLIETQEGALMRELARGIAQAANETGAADRRAVDAWLTARLAATACEIGHTDIFAMMRPDAKRRLSV